MVSIMKDDKWLKEMLWGFFAEYWDDEVVVGASRKVLINARTIRVLRSMFGNDLVIKCLHRWKSENSVKILGDSDDLDPDAPCIQVTAYVSKIS